MNSRTPPAKLANVPKLFAEKIEKAAKAEAKRVAAEEKQLKEAALGSSRAEAEASRDVTAWRLREAPRWGGLGGAPGETRAASP